MKPIHYILLAAVLIYAAYKGIHATDAQLPVVMPPECDEDAAA